MSATNPFTWGLGRRKTAVARVRVKSGTGRFEVNGKQITEYFNTVRDLTWAQAPIGLLAVADTYDVFVNVKGGGPHGQAGAVQLGLARALKELSPVIFEEMRAKGYLTRDPRMVERKKPGRSGARRGFQFSKR